VVSASLLASSTSCLAHSPCNLAASVSDLAASAAHLAASAALLEASASVIASASFRLIASNSALVVSASLLASSTSCLAHSPCNLAASVSDLAASAAHLAASASDLANSVSDFAASASNLTAFTCSSNAATSTRVVFPPALCVLPSNKSPIRPPNSSGSTASSCTACASLRTSSAPSATFDLLSASSCVPFATLFFATSTSNISNSATSMLIVARIVGAASVLAPVSPIACSASQSSRRSASIPACRSASSVHACISIRLPTLLGASTPMESEDWPPAACISSGESYNVMNSNPSIASRLVRKVYGSSNLLDRPTIGSAAPGSRESVLVDRLACSLSNNSCVIFCLWCIWLGCQMRWPCSS